MKKDILLNSYKSATDGNKTNYVMVDLVSYSSMVPIENYVKQLDEYEQYLREMENSKKHRVCLVINPVCSNVLFNNLTEPGKDGRFFLLDAELEELAPKNKYDDYRVGLNLVKKSAEGRNNASTVSYYTENKRVSPSVISDSICSVYITYSDEAGNTLKKIIPFTFRRDQYVEPTNNGDIVVNNLKPKNMFTTEPFIVHDEEELEEDENEHSWIYIDVRNARTSVVDNTVKIYVTKTNYTLWNVLQEHNGWFGISGYDNYDTREKPEILQEMFPSSDCFTFNPFFNENYEREEKNWEVFLTYPYRKVDTNPLIKNGIQCKVVSADYVYNGEIATGDTPYEADKVEINEEGKLVVRSNIRHNLQPGDGIRFFIDPQKEDNGAGTSTRTEEESVDNYAVKYKGTEITLEDIERTAIRNLIENMTYAEGVGVIRFREGLTTLKRGIFNGRDVTDIIISKTFTIIEGEAFLGCKSLKNINLGNIRVIEGDAFKSCTGLTTITFPDTLETIQKNAFRGASNLKTVVCKGTSAPEVFQTSFDTGSAYIADTKMYQYPRTADYSSWKKVLGVVGWVGQKVDPEANQNYDTVDTEVEGIGFDTYSKEYFFTVPALSLANYLKLSEPGFINSGTTGDSVRRYFFKADITGINNLWFKRLDSGVECEYYFRIFRKIPNFRGSEVNMENGFSDEDMLVYGNRDFNKIFGRIAFAKNAYGDEMTQVVYTDDIDLTNLRDYMGREVSEIYATVVKVNQNHDLLYVSGVTDSAITRSSYFGRIDCGVEAPVYTDDYNIHKIHGVNFYSVVPELREFLMESPVSLSEVTTDDTEFYGDIVEFSPVALSERVIEDVYHRFNTVQREYVDLDISSGVCYLSATTVWRGYQCNVNPEGYYYQAHYRIPIRDFDETVQEGFDIRLNQNWIPANEETGNIDCFTFTDTNGTPVLDIEMYEKLVVYNRVYRNEKSIYEVIYKNNGMYGVVRVDGVVPIDMSTKAMPETELIGTNGFVWYRENKEKPVSAYNVNDSTGRYIWRDVEKYANTPRESDIYDELFTSGRHYHYKYIDFYLRRQDPFGEYGLSFAYINECMDISGNTVCLADTCIGGEEKNLELIDNMTEMEEQC